MTTWLAVLARRHGCWQALLVQRARPPEVKAWAFPAGSAAVDEPTAAAACHELAEATGIQLDPDEFVPVDRHTYPADSVIPTASTRTSCTSRLSRHSSNPSPGQTSNGRWWPLHDPMAAWDGPTLAQVKTTYQKRSISLYLLRSHVGAASAQRLQGYDMRKGCLRFRRPETIDYDLRP